MKKTSALSLMSVFIFVVSTIALMRFFILYCRSLIAARALSLPWPNGSIGRRNTQH
jgi:hypothetical protein